MKKTISLLIISTLLTACATRQNATTGEEETNSTTIGLLSGAVAGALAGVLLTPKPEAPANSNRNQASATNALGNRINEAAIGSRVDDIWGKVANFVPRLIQLPHARFDGNTEQEHFAMACVGKGLIEDVHDGGTDFSLLTNGKFNAWQRP